MCVWCMCECACYGMLTEVKGQVYELFLFYNVNPVCHQVWKQVSLLAEPSCWFSLSFFLPFFAFLLSFVFVFFKTGFLCVALAVLVLCTYTDHRDLPATAS